MYSLQNRLGMWTMTHLSSNLGASPIHSLSFFPSPRAGVVSPQLEAVRVSHLLSSPALTVHPRPLLLASWRWLACGMDRDSGGEQRSHPNYLSFLPSWLFPFIQLYLPTLGNVKTLLPAEQGTCSPLLPFSVGTDPPLTRTTGSVHLELVSSIPSKKTK